MSKKKESTGRRLRERTFVIRMTAEEREELAKYAEEHSINLSALARKLLFERLCEEKD